MMKEELDIDLNRIHVCGSCIEVNDDGFWTMVLLDGETRPVLYKVESLQQIYPFKISIEKDGKISIG